MTKTKYWLSILAISVVLVAGSLAVSPIAIADDDDDDEEVEASIEAELEIEQGDSVDVEVEAEGLASGVTFVVRGYSMPNCSKPDGAMASIVGSDISDGDGEIEISGSVGFAAFVTDVNSVSIRSPGPGPGFLVVCFQDTTP